MILSARPFMYSQRAARTCHLDLRLHPNFKIVFYEVSPTTTEKRIATKLFAHQYLLDLLSERGTFGISRDEFDLIRAVNSQAQFHGPGDLLLLEN